MRFETPEERLEGAKDELWRENLRHRLATKRIQRDINDAMLDDDEFAEVYGMCRGHQLGECAECGGRGFHKMDCSRGVV